MKFLFSIDIWKTRIILKSIETDLKIIDVIETYLYKGIRLKWIEIEMDPD